MILNSDMLITDTFHSWLVFVELNGNDSTCVILISHLLIFGTFQSWLVFVELNGNDSTCMILISHLLITDTFQSWLVIVELNRNDSNCMILNSDILITDTFQSWLVFVELKGNDSNCLILNICGNNINTIQANVDTTVKQLLRCFEKNRLLININKTVAMSFHNRQNNNIQCPTIKLHDQTISFTNSIKFLGL